MVEFLSLILTFNVIDGILFVLLIFTKTISNSFIYVGILPFFFFVPFINFIFSYLQSPIYQTCPFLLQFSISSNFMQYISWQVFFCSLTFYVKLSSVMLAFLFDCRRSIIAEGVISELQKDSFGFHSRSDSDSEGAQIFKLLETAAEPEVLMADMNSEQLASFANFRAKQEVRAVKV